jgi:hypothetical protein
MNNLWSQGTTVLPLFNHSYKYNTFDKVYQINNRTSDDSGCSSHIHCDNRSYTLSFGHLLSGNLYCYQSFNPIRQCYKSYSIDRAKSSSNLFNNTLQMNNIQSQENLIINHKVNEAMKTIRKSIKNVKKRYDYSMPSVPYCYNPIMSNYNQNKTT